MSIELKSKRKIKIPKAVRSCEVCYAPIKHNQPVKRCSDCLRIEHYTQVRLITKPDEERPRGRRGELPRDEQEILKTAEDELSKHDADDVRKQLGF